MQRCSDLFFCHLRSSTMHPEAGSLAGSAGMLATAKRNRCGLSLKLAAAISNSPHRPGDKWCLCASRWAEAKRVREPAGIALLPAATACLSCAPLQPAAVLPAAPTPHSKCPCRPAIPPPAHSQAGAAPPVLLAATHIRALDYVSLADLREHAIDTEEAEAGAAAAKAAARSDKGTCDGEGAAPS